MQTIEIRQVIILDVNGQPCGWKLQYRTRSFISVVLGFDNFGAWQDMTTVTVTDTA